LVAMSGIEPEDIPQNHRHTLSSLVAAYLKPIKFGETPH